MRPTADIMGPGSRGLLYSSMILAVVSLLIGSYLIYKLALRNDPSDASVIEVEGKRYAPTEGSVLTVSATENTWVPKSISAQFGAMILFLIALLVSIVPWGAQEPPGSSSRAVAARFVVSKDLPPLGTNLRDLLSAWGAPSDSADSRLTYHGIESVIVFCLQDDTVSRIIEHRRSADGDSGSC